MEFLFRSWKLRGNENCCTKMSQFTVLSEKNKLDTIYLHLQEAKFS